MADTNGRGGRFPGRKREIIYFFITFLFAVFAVRLFHLQVIRNDYYRKLALSNRIRRERVLAPRGLIRDSKGRKMVIDTPRYQVEVLPGEARGNEERVRLACEWMKIDGGKLIENLNRWNEKYPDGRAMTVLSNADKRQISILMENRELFPFFKLLTKHRRKYLYGSTAAHILGYVGEVTEEEVQSSEEIRPGEIIGRAGVEYQYDRYLRGTDGVRLVETNAGGKKLGEYYSYFEDGQLRSRTRPHPPVPGNQLYLTINLDLQQYLDRALEGRRGSIVIMEPATGRILAASSYPDFDPNTISVGITGEIWDSLNYHPEKPLFNRSVQATYPPGSIHKLMVAYIYLKEGNGPGMRSFEPCAGRYRFGNRYFKCWKEEGHGRLDLYRSIVQSCDVYFYQIGKMLSANTLAEGGRVFGMGRKTGIDLPSEAAGLIPDRDYFDRKFGKGKWTRGHLLNCSIGQGDILATPVQLALITSIFANGGKMVVPHLVDRILDAGEEVVYLGSGNPRPVSRLDREAFRYVRRAMRGVVEEELGTGRFSRVEGLTSAGKTGTSQNPHGEDHALFVAFAPVKSPRFAIVVVLENAGHGGVEAGPLARDVMRYYFREILGEIPGHAGNDNNKAGEITVSDPEPGFQARPAAGR
ncbi:MAG: penicillin-binding protein 2 [Candidatus Krumholzibacteriales bacterium]